MDPPEPQIVNGATPATSDKLARRNLTIVGVASPRQVPLTSAIKPTRASLHTLTCVARGITYVPVPPGGGARTMPDC